MVKPRGGACRKLKKTLRALESKFSRGTNIINHQFWVSSEEQHTRGAYYSWRVLFKRGRDGDSGRLGRSERERESEEETVNERKGIGRNQRTGGEESVGGTRAARKAEYISRLETSLA